jgi:hypothetical protein
MTKPYSTPLHAPSAHFTPALRCALIAAVATMLLMHGARVLAQSADQAASDKAAAVVTLTEHDGAHDFDFLIGRWKAHLKTLPHPLTGSNEWVEYDGVSDTRKIWDEHSNTEEFEVDSPASHRHIKGQTLRLYNPASHQWSIYLVYADKGRLEIPPVVGQFTDGRGEFLDQEDYNGRAILVRFVWTHDAHSSAHMEQSFSADDGRTWEVNWICELVRIDS